MFGFIKNNISLIFWVHLEINNNNFAILNIFSASVFSARFPKVLFSKRKFLRKLLWNGKMIWVQIQL